MADIRYENGEIVQTYARGGPIASPYASSLTPMQGVGGLFQDQNQFGRDVADLRGSPLQNYQEYLMGTYGKMAADTVQQAAQQDVEHFVKLVDEAERAHFGSEESFGFGGGQMHLDSLSAFDKGPESLSMGNAMTRAIGEDGGGGFEATTMMVGEDGGGGGISADPISAMITQASFEDGGGGGVPLLNSMEAPFAMPTADRPKGMTRAMGEDGVGPNPLLSGGMAMTQAMGEDGGGGNRIQGGIEPVFAQLFENGGEVDGGVVLGKKTGETTTAGRDVYVAPNGDQMSEKSMTFEIDGLFVNIPSIHNGTLYSSEKIYEMFMNGEIQPTSAHRTEKEAISAAQQRSDALLP